MQSDSKVLRQHCSVACTRQVVHVRRFVLAIANCGDFLDINRKQTLSSATLNLTLTTSFPPEKKISSAAHIVNLVFPLQCVIFQLRRRQNMYTLKVWLIPNRTQTSMLNSEL